MVHVSSMEYVIKGERNMTGKDLAIELLDMPLRQDIKARCYTQGYRALYKVVEVHRSTMGEPDGECIVLTLQHIKEKVKSK